MERCHPLYLCVSLATKVKERGTVVLAAAAATLVNPGTPLQAKL